ncbi:FG-GAP-like repeat-containing protein [Puniceicoccaceae bacterium K14]|nr:FG-GAP-like repeat-containing protein [Puniceicoccaceae bacterium K14]
MTNRIQTLLTAIVLFCGASVYAAAPQPVNLTVDETYYPGEAINMSFRATDSDGDLKHCIFYYWQYSTSSWFPIYHPDHGFNYPLSGSDDTATMSWVPVPDSQSPVIIHVGVYDHAGNSHEQATNPTTGGTGYWVVVESAQEKIVGTLPGEFLLDGKGAANYSIPLEVPPGINGMQPVIAIGYNSNSRNGVVGYGWNLTHGFPTEIARGQNIFARDGSLRAVDFTSEDKFYIEGKRLIPVVGSQGAANSVYHTEIESFSKIAANGLSTNQGSSFTMKSKDGLIMKFGGEGQSAGHATTFLGGESGDSHLTVPYAWKLRRVEGLHVGTSSSHGYIEYTYGSVLDEDSAESGEYILEEIHYGGNTGSQDEVVAKIDFVYEDRTDFRQLYRWGGAMPQTKILKHVDVYSVSGNVDTKLSRYTLNYEASPSTTRSLLKSMEWTAYNEDGAYSVEPTTFKYTGHLDEENGEKAYEKFKITNAKDWLHRLYSLGFKSYYLEGEEGTGIFGTITGSWYYGGGYGGGFSTGDGLDEGHGEAELADSTYDFGDFNGDGHLDLIVAREPISSVGGIEVYLGGPRHNFEEIHQVDVINDIPGINIRDIVVGDFNGDAVDDVLLKHSSKSYLLNFYKSDVLSYGSLSLGIEDLGYAKDELGRAGYDDRSISKVDFDGDGKDDIFRGTLCYSSSVSSGVEFGEVHYLPKIIDQEFARFGSEEFDADSALGGVDMNGDFMDDIVLFDNDDSRGASSSGTYVLLSNGGGLHLEKKWNELDDSSYTCGLKAMGDVNGDKLPDIVQPDEGNFIVYLNTGTESKDGENWTLDISETVGSQRPIFRDVNGDGLQDCIVKGPNSGENGYLVYQSTGHSFKSPYYLIPRELNTESGGTATFWNSFGPIFLDLDNSHNGHGLVDMIAGNHFEGWQVAYNVGIAADYLSEIENGLGAKTYVDYTNLTSEEHYTSGPDVAYPIADKRDGGVRIVSNVWKDNGAGSGYTDTNGNGKWDSGEPINGDMYRFTYQYSGYRLDHSGRGSLGFHSILTYDHQTDLMNYQFFSQSFPMTGLTKREQSFRPSNIVTDSNGNLTSYSLEPLNVQDNDVTFDEVSNHGTLYPFLSHSSKLSWELGEADVLDIDGNSTESLFSLYNSNYMTNKDKAHSVVDTYVWFDNQNQDSPYDSDLPSAYDDDPNYVPGQQDGSAVGFEDWDLAANSMNLPGLIDFGNIGRERTDYNDGHVTDTASTFWENHSSDLTGLVKETQTQVKVPGDTSFEGGPKIEYTYDSSGLLQTKKINGAPSNSAPFVDSLVGDDRLSTTTTYNYSDYGQVESTTVEDHGSEQYYDIGSQARTLKEVVEWDTTNRFPKKTQNAYGHWIETRSFDGFGRALEVYEINDPSNGTHTTYDALGRATEVDNRLLGIKVSTKTRLVADSLYDSNSYKKVELPSNIPSAHTNEMSDAQVLVAKYYELTDADNANPLLTLYDRLGRKIRTIQWGYKNKQAITDTIYDVQGRVVAVSRPYENGTAASDILWTFSRYDELGRVDLVSIPAVGSDGDDYTTTATTFRGLVTQVTTDGPSLNGVDPSAKTTTTLANAKGDTVKIWNADNVPGSFTTKSVDGTASLEFVQDGFGRATEVTVWQGLDDPGGASVFEKTSMEYDILGNQTLLDDPDKGEWEYIYNALGELTWQEDPQGNTVVMSYDLIGRPIQRFSSESSTIWYYYESAENVSDPVYIHDADRGWIGAVRIENVVNYSHDWSESGDIIRNAYFYDDKGNVETVLNSIDNKWMYRHFRYDNLNRIEHTDYYWRPAGYEDDYEAFATHWFNFSFQNFYDENHFIETVIDSEGRIWWDEDGNDGYDYLGRPYKYKAGNIVTEHSYDAASGAVKTISTGGGTVQDDTYTYDALGNLRTRSNGTRTETFSYDVLDRLKTSQVTGKGERSFSYYANGNIKSKENLEANSSSTYSYGASQPHAVTSAFGYNMTYDDSGNVKSRTGNGETWAFKWNTFDKPIWMGKEENGAVSGSAFVYGIDRMRVKHYEFDSFDKSGSTLPENWKPGRLARKKIYIGEGSLEYDFVNNAVYGQDPSWQVQRFRLYVPGPNGRLGAIEIDPNEVGVAAQDPQVYHYDHLGSIAAITPFGSSSLDDDKEGKDSLYSYDAWGERRDGTSWHGAPANTSLGGSADWATRGFTGHEMLDDIGLIHMNGRIYDSLLGRFLSSDIIVDGVATVQGYNRYSYVGNNPLAFTDPSGYSALFRFPWGNPYGIDYDILNPTITNEDPSFEAENHLDGVLVRVNAEYFLQDGKMSPNEYGQYLANNASPDEIVLQYSSPRTILVDGVEKEKLDHQYLVMGRERYIANTRNMIGFSLINRASDLLVEAAGAGVAKFAGGLIAKGAKGFPKPVIAVSKVADSSKVFVNAAEFADDVMAFNRGTNGKGVLKGSSNPMTALQSASYYDDVAQQGASIFKSISHGHMFLNGNKRTAVYAFQQFANNSGLTINHSYGDLMDIATQVATGDLSDVADIAKALTR